MCNVTLMCVQYRCRQCVVSDGYDEYRDGHLKTTDRVTTRNDLIDASVSHLSVIFYKEKGAQR